MSSVKVLIIMGSRSDLSVMRLAKETLDSLGIASEMRIASAHRTPEMVLNLVRESEGAGVRVIIAGAGYAAHLAGVIASHTTLPVIGVPLASSDLKGIDSLLATVQMPPGVPVATVGIGEAGAKNAAFLAAEILATDDVDIRKKVEKAREDMRKKIEEDDKDLTCGKSI
jgi:phosphoribosylaminoimidazole carboxylase PurE protein